MNIRQVAEQANVSTATVSRVISNVINVRPQTRARVEQVIKSLGYVPNSNARSLSLGRSGLFGMIISDITNPFFPELVRTFTELAEKNHMGAIVSHTNYDTTRMERGIQRMLEEKAEGVAIMTSELSKESMRQLIRRKVPTVILDSSDTVSGAYMRHIRIDYETGLRQAVNHLAELGHKRFAFIAGPKDLRSALWRQTIFLNVLKERGININSETFVYGNHKVDGGYDAMAQLLALKARPTAVLCSNDLTAFGAITCIYEAGLQVPRDISIVGYDDIELSRAYNPPLTTVSLSRVEIASRAFDLLYAAARKKRGKSNAEPVPTQLLVRKSTGRPPKEN